MAFILMPLLERMEQFYNLPRDRQRFETYLEMMLDDKRQDLELPIAAFNPMGKDLVLAKIRELRQIGAEEILAEAIASVNANVIPDSEIRVAINLVDDLGGAWSNRYSTDYTSKFAFAPTLKRNFCLPFFFTGEAYTSESIRRNVSEYMFRSIYVLQHGSPETLQGHLDQEVFVAQQLQAKEASSLTELELELVKNHASEHADSTDYNLIFNFFYGDRAGEALGYQAYGMPEQGGFYYAIWLAQQG